MSDRVWVRSIRTDAVREVAESALPALLRSGWQQLNRVERERLAAGQLAAKSARVESLTARPRRVDDVPPGAPQDEPPADAPAIPPRSSGRRRSESTTTTTPDEQES